MTILPHINVLARLGVSAIHGIGVFAGREIPAGMTLFGNDQRPLRWVSEAAVAASSPSEFEQRFYDDFAVRRDGLLGTPNSFDVLTIGWYVNEPSEGNLPNLKVLPDLSFVAARDIRAGEELTANYSDFSEQP